MKVLLKGKAMVYVEIANEYKKYITLGIIKDGDKLPSVRELASELGINPNTVERAYKILEDEAYIKTLPKKGSYVSNQNNNIQHDIDLLKLQIKSLKNNKVEQDTIYEIINKIYGEDK